MSWKHREWGILLCLPKDTKVWDQCPEQLFWAHRTQDILPYLLHNSCKATCLTGTKYRMHRDKHPATGVNQNTSQGRVSLWVNPWGNKAFKTKNWAFENCSWVHRFLQQASAQEGWAPSSACRTLQHSFPSSRRFPDFTPALIPPGTASTPAHSVHSSCWMGVKQLHLMSSKSPVLKN